MYSNFNKKIALIDYGARCRVTFTQMGMRQYISLMVNVINAKPPQSNAAHLAAALTVTLVVVEPFPKTLGHKPK